MKKIFLTSTAVLFLTTSFGQKNEYRLALNSGLFSFTGASSAAVSFINYNKQSNSGYTNNPYGSQQGLCYGISGNWKRILKSNILFGLDLGYERLRSKIAINNVSGSDRTSSYQYDATGKTNLNSNFINFQPFIGYRLLLKSVRIDFTGGLDVGYCLGAKEKGSATATDGTKYKTSVNRKTITTDVRPRLQLSTDYKAFGVYVGYSFGQLNYLSGAFGGTPECYARLLRFGTTYRLK